MFNDWESSYAKKENYHVKYFSMNPQIEVKGDTETNRGAHAGSEQREAPQLLH